MPATVTQLHNGPPTPVEPTGSLTERAMLARLTITKWSGRKGDKKLNAEIAEAHSSDISMHRVSRLLLNKDAMSNIAKIAAEARDHHYQATLPWLDEGSRILPADNFFDYTDRQRSLKQAWDDAVEQFVSEYDRHVEDARKRLGDLFDIAEYPRAESVRTSFNYETGFSPLPDANDFRVQIGDDAVAGIKQDLEARLGVAAEEAMKDLWGRVYEQVAHMVERLNAFKPAVKANGKTEEKAEGVFRDSLIENMRGLVELLPRLNLTGSAELAAMTQRLRDELCVESADTLRKDEKVRENVAIAAERILEEVKDFLA